MKTLNLTSLEQSDIKYKIQNFPDGQKSIIVDPKTEFGPGGSVIAGYGDIYLQYPVQIKSRLNNMEDFGLIACAVACLRELGIQEIHLYTPYFMGARSDRQFEEGGNWYLKDVICPMINALNFKSVTVLDPHSYVLGNLIKGFKSETNEELVKWSLAEIYNSPGPLVFDKNMTNFPCVLVSPDAGASHKIHKLAEAIGYKGDIITCSKERAADGKLSRTVVPDFDLSKDVVIIDDIFDFGGTFKNIGGAMNDMGHQGKKYLIVTHAIQDAGLEDALKWFDCIFTTDSYKSRLSTENLKILEVF